MSCDREERRVRPSLKLIAEPGLPKFTSSRIPLVLDGELVVPTAMELRNCCAEG